MIRAVIVAFNEETWLPGCLESLRDQVDQVVVIDGAYARYPHDQPFSTDATRQIAWCYGAQWVECPEDTNGRSVPWQSEVEKLNAVCALASDGDWTLKIDADERLIGELPRLGESQHYALQLTGERGRPGWAMRLWQARGWMRFEGSHVALWRDHVLLRPQDAAQIDPARCRLAHLHSMRAADRLATKRGYADWLTRGEREYRRQHGI